MKTIGEAARFFLTRYWVRDRIGPYVVTTAEVRPSAYKTSVSWGEDGPELDEFGSGLAFEPAEADVNHEAVCGRVEARAGLARVPAQPPPAA